MKNTCVDLISSTYTPDHNMDNTTIELFQKPPQETPSLSGFECKTYYAMQEVETIILSNDSIHSNA